MLIYLYIYTRYLIYILNTCLCRPNPTQCTVRDSKEVETKEDETIKTKTRRAIIQASMA